ncbi:nicotinate phosphoribosyltransferase [Gilbertella persicaria]|uniref:nicotinate phosphoribosyltransferase n=1 Tax=Gilbertella persicaria TaxID=101096 RepID=UPI00221FEC4A|nr:nicotinate phosphoribosyltransferase [Gilbertella persicaria]KAI8098220.1 nicotinate phosphoribosyltransferase [Gilbertella persicaria]
MEQSNHHEVFKSILDNDLYKFTMQQAVIQHYKKDVPVVYQFTNREKHLSLNTESVKWLKKQVKDLELLKLTESERDYLSRLPYMTKEYVDYLFTFQYKPSEQVNIEYDESTGDLQLEVTGKWHETILYEVPLLALISEAYFRFTDRDWNYEGQVEQAAEKTRILLEHGCIFSEFGTRRRRDYKTHDLVMNAIHRTHQEYKKKCEEAGVPTKGNVSGTSNVYLAMKYNVPAVGTCAHEFFMAVSALEDVQHANRETLHIWYEVYKGALGIALTDTFTTEIFLRDFDHDLATQFAGVRQDSGDAFEFIDKMVAHYKSVGVDPSTKTIVFSDSLNVERAIKLHERATQAGIQSSFGIGTSFTNDFHKISDVNTKSKALNIVIKLRECAGKRVIKLSDDPLKYSADASTISAFKQTLGIVN